MMKNLLATLALVSIACGCGGGDEFELAPVSGVVKLDGQPLANATVSFQPTAKSKNPGPLATGTTNEQGEFSLSTSKGKGATVGENKVLISLMDQSGAAGHGDGGGDTGKKKKGGHGTSDPGPSMGTEKIPARYNSNSQLTFTVPSGGSDEANFDLQSK